MTAGSLGDGQKEQMGELNIALREAEWQLGQYSYSS